MRRAIFIVGPTAVGKSKVAFKISKKIPSVLISADSVQVYRGADIISGKDRSVPTYLLDILSPKQSYSVRGFVESVCSIVEKAENQHKIPVIVGGTGFYIDALFGKIETINIPPDLKLRKQLNELSIDELQKKLQTQNPTRFQKMNKSDVNNKRRLMRAIEVAGSKNKKSKVLLSEDEILMIGLKTSIDNLRRRIAARVKERLKMGALGEVRELFKNYEKLSLQIRVASGYRELFSYLASEIGLGEAIRRWIISESQLAKRQMTWFQRNKNITWFDIEEKGFESKIVKLVKHNFPE